MAEHENNVFEHVQLLDRNGFCCFICPVEFAASPEGKILAQAMQDINKMRNERKNED